MNKQTTNNTVNAFIGFSGAPYLIKMEQAAVSDSGSVATGGITNLVNYYPLKDTVYAGEFTVKLGIYYGGSIEKREELVHPSVSQIIAEYGLTGDAILWLHKGNKRYLLPVDSQMQFDAFDSSTSIIKIVSPVQIGKECWDCCCLPASYCFKSAHREVAKRNGFLCEKTGLCPHTTQFRESALPHL